MAAELDAREGPRHAVRAAWAAVWPDEQLRWRRLHELGLDVLLALDQRQLRAFFAAFFGLPREDWQAYLSGRGDARTGARVIWWLLRPAPPPLRRTLARHGAARAGAIARALR